MKISGFTMVRNATKQYYPTRPAIESILPIVDEFIVALGNSDDGDTTEQEIQKINSDKIKIIHTEWDLEKFTGGTVYAQQTNLAKEYCTGDWLFYIQSDEVVHERYLPAIKKRCEELLDDYEIEGLLFNYRHFYGSYDYIATSSKWYSHEIRIIKNNPDIYSYKDAQGFRKGNNQKLQVKAIPAFINHYGWVKTPQAMQRKQYKQRKRQES